MENLLEIWEWVKRITGIFLLVCLCLYAVRCVKALDIVSFNQFEHFFRGLVAYIFG